VRGAVFPVIALADALSSDRIKRRRKGPRWQLAIIDAAEESYGLVVDQFLGEVEVVTKPLNCVLSKVPGYAGAAIMVNSRPALAVNTERLFSLIAKRPWRRSRFDASILYLNLRTEGN
jgi:two-component system chemotaxis sensor kinase CheA